MKKIVKIFIGLFISFIFWVVWDAGIRMVKLLLS